MVGCQLDIWEQAPEPMVHGDLPNEVENSQTAVGLLFASGEIHELELTAETYKVVVATEAVEEAVRVDLRRLD